MDWINVIDTEPGRKSKTWNAYVLHGIPTALLIDGETGEILARSVGSGMNLHAILSELLP